MKTTWFASGALVAGLCGCSSTPVHYHTLVAPPRGAVVSPSHAPFALDVLPVSIPAQLNQADLVVRRGATSVDIVDSERWASPFSDEVRTALSAELTRQLGTYDIGGLTSSTDGPLVRVKVQVRRFDAWPGETVQIEADWRVTFTGSGTKPLTCATSLSATAPHDYAGLVLAQQSVLHGLASEIGTGIIAAMQNQHVECDSL